jgi:hypothetical protein
MNAQLFRKSLLGIALLGFFSSLSSPLHAAAEQTADSGATIKARVGTGFGVNQFRGFNTNAQTQYFIDGEQISGAPGSNTMGLGSRVNVQLGPDANNTVTEGTAQTVFLDNALRGPVTSVAPNLKVLGQAIAYNANTVLIDIPAGDLTQVTLGTGLEVAGQIDANNSFVATRITRSQPENNWRLTGFLTAVNVAASTASVGTQTLSFVGVTPLDCTTPLAIGQYVEVRATPITPFTPPQVINTVTRLRCGTPALPGTVGAPGAVDGVVSTVNSVTEFKLNAITVTHGPTTFYRNGATDDILPGVRLEVEGIYTAPTSITASKIRFIYPIIRLQAPVNPADIAPNTSITILGKTVRNTPQLRDEDGIIANGLNVQTMVEVRGYIDNAGVLFGTRVRTRGAVRPDKYVLKGPVGEINAGEPRLKILGININTTTSTFQNSTDQPITAAAFFAAVAVGRSVDVSDAFYNAVTNTISGGVIALEDDDFANRAGLNSKLVNNATVSGTLTEALLETLFIGNFE